MASKTQTASADRYYYADGKKVPLNLSARFVAVRVAGDENARSAAASAAERMSTLSSPAQVMTVPEYDLVVIALPGAQAGAASGAEAARALMPGATGPNVYEMPDDASPAAAVVPVGEVLVKFKPDASEDARRRLLGKLKLQVKQHDYPEPGSDLVTTDGDDDAIDAANALQESGLVEFAQPNFVHLSPRPAAGTAHGNGHAAAIEAAEFGEPADVDRGADAAPTLAATDPAFASQWNLKKIKAPEAWDITTGSSSIAIAILDEGCDMTHEDITYKLPGYDAFAADNNPQPNGNDAHGTACAGVAAARMNNGKGGAGVAPGCKVMPIRIAQGIGGGFWSTTDAKVADGIRKAVDAPRSADVLSNSYGVGASTVVTNAFKYAQTNGRGGKGCPIAAAAGNSDAPPVLYPAKLASSIRGMMAVSATNEWDQRKSKTSLDGETWWGSSYGPEVDIAAPGVHIHSPDIMGGAGYGAGNYIPNFNGTSSATPHVAGLMGLILSVDPDLRSWEVEDIIKLTADDLGPAGRDQQFGFGRINCRRALEAASRLWYSISITPQFLGAGKECFMRINVRFYNPGINTVRLDGFTLTSHNPTWTAEVDRFTFQPNPGSVLAPRTNQDVRANGILLKANGNQSSWSYRWAINWNYTFWRPSAPGFPLSALDASDQGAGVSVTTNRAQGNSQGTTPRASAGQNDVGEVGADGADLVTIDRQSRKITIVVQ